MTQWKQLTIYVDESAHWQHQPVYTALIELARRHGLAGATATRAIEGFSKNSGIHTANLLDLSCDLPIVVTLIDRSEAIAQFLPTVQQMVGTGLVTVQTVEVLHHAPL